MNRDETKKAVAVMQAYVDGAEIEYNAPGYGEWRIVAGKPFWSWSQNQYRVKPKKPRIGDMMLTVKHPEKYVMGIELTPEVKEALEKAGISYE